MITHLDADAVRYEGDRPVAAGDQELTQPTVTARTASGVWGLYAAGDEVVVVHPAGAMRGRPGDLRAELEGIAGDQARAGEERQAVGSLLPYLGGDDPGTVADIPRSQSRRGRRRPTGSPTTATPHRPASRPPRPSRPGARATRSRRARPAARPAGAGSREGPRRG
jgi:hypothetical protein